VGQSVVRISNFTFVFRQKGNLSNLLKLGTQSGNYCVWYRAMWCKMFVCSSVRLRIASKRPMCRRSYFINWLPQYFFIFLGTEPLSEIPTESSQAGR